MDQKKELYIRMGLQLVSTVCLVIALFGMMKGNQTMIAWGLIVASVISGGTSLERYLKTRKLSQLVLAVMLFVLCAIFVASLFM